MELIQVRVDAETKAAAASLFEALGMDISTAVRSFLKKAIAEGGMPFDMKLDDSPRPCRRPLHEGDLPGER